MRIYRLETLACSFLGILVLSLCVGAIGASAQQAPVTGQVEIAKRNAPKKLAKANTADDESDVVVWLTPVDHSAPATSVSSDNAPRMIQRNKMFEPRMLVVRAGTSVQFPNMDPFFHNVFSLFNGKRFDLGLYEAGTTKSVRFDRVGVSFLFCNIHEGMNAVIVAVPTPYFATSDRSGRITIPNVPDGRYQMQVWYERSSPEDLKSLQRTVMISASSRTLETVHVVDDPNFSLAHKNKYGENYVPPPDSGYAIP